MKFIRALCTNTRLMGSQILLIDWCSESHIFLLDSEGLGLSDFNIINDGDSEEVYNSYRNRSACLGGLPVEISYEEAIFLVNDYMSKNIRYEKPLAENFSQDMQNYYKNRLKELGEISKDINNEIYKKTITKIESDYEFINYMVMRMIARDRESLMYFSGSEKVANVHLTNINGALLYNEVKKISDDRYKCICVYEDNDGYYESSLVVMIEKNILEKAYTDLYEDDELEYMLRGFMIIDTRGIYDFEVFDIISKSEIVDIYEIHEKVDLDEIYKQIGHQFSTIDRINYDKGVLFTQYFADNSHIDRPIYIINNDIMFIIYVSDKNLYLANYSERGRELVIELLEDRLGGYLEYKDSFSFEQNVLFDFIESGNDDFHDFLD